MSFYRKLTLIIILALLSAAAFAHPNNVTLELEQADLKKAVQTLAKLLDINVLLSSSIEGTVSLHVHEVAPEQAFDLLLQGHGLAKKSYGKMWYIAPYKEMIAQMQNDLAWRSLEKQTSKLISEIWPIKYANAVTLAKLLHDEHPMLLSKRGRVRADKRTNYLYIRDTNESVAKVRNLVKALDQPAAQILIEARLVSMDCDYEQQLGLAFATVKEGKSKDKTENAGQYTFTVAKLADNTLLDVRLSALESAGVAELISRPSLFTSNQETASIEAGEEVPYQEVSESGGTAVVFKKAVLGLKVTPQVLPGNQVLLQLKINQDRPSNKMVLGMPTISTRQMSTQVLLKHGQTIVLGGIFETNREQGTQGLPYISRIPIIGRLFRTDSRRKNKRELLIFVTPKIIHHDYWKS